MPLGPLLGKYRRWNPVHPTGGAFWGIGVGLGCGVGWGFGFGPEAVGFVGSGCGVGFSIGVTFIGVGVGLPSNGVIKLPLNALALTAKGAANTTSTVVVPAVVFAAQQCWQALSSGVAEIGPHSTSIDNSPSSKGFVGQEDKVIPDRTLKSDQNGVPPSSVRPQQASPVTPPRNAAVLPRRHGNFVEDARHRR